MTENDQIKITAKHLAIRVTGLEGANVQLRKQLEGIEQKLVAVRLKEVREEKAQAVPLNQTCADLMDKVSSLEAQNAWVNVMNEKLLREVDALEKKNEFYDESVPGDDRYTKLRELNARLIADNHKLRSLRDQVRSLLTPTPPA